MADYRLRRSRVSLVLGSMGTACLLTGALWGSAWAMGVGCLLLLIASGVLFFG